MSSEGIVAGWFESCSKAFFDDLAAALDKNELHPILDSSAMPFESSKMRSLSHAEILQQSLLAPI